MENSYKDFARFDIKIRLRDIDLNEDFDYFAERFGNSLMTDLTAWTWHHLKNYVEDHKHEHMPSYKIEVTLSCKEN